MLLLYTSQQSNRLDYIARFVLEDVCGVPLTITDDAEFFSLWDKPKINYSHNFFSNALCIKPHGLLFEKTIQPQAIDCYEEQGLSFFFKTQDSDFLFDIFSASFYLLSRYEEYLPHEKDEYGRFAHHNSVAFKNNFLHVPLVNEWSLRLQKKFLEKFPGLTFKKTGFKFIPTYDIDIAYSIKGKGWARNTGSMLKALTHGQFSELKQRINVLLGKEKDPYDSYDWLNEIHQQFDLSPIYFFLIADKIKGYDRNILPNKKIMQQLISAIALQYQVGIHPSWRSNHSIQIVQEEINNLKQISQSEIIFSRQHYIKMQLPNTYRNLLQAGIEVDYSMGYGSINGFRASVATPFWWFDLEKNETTHLKIIPFCFMDANSFYELKHSPEQALDELMKLLKTIKKVNGTMVTIWHNQFLGTSKMFAGWREIYLAFLHVMNSSRRFN